MPDLKQLQKEVELIEKKLRIAGAKRKRFISSLHHAQQISAYNLIHYLALRNEDVRSMQDELHHAGLSGLANSESHILKQLQAVRQRLGSTIKDAELSQCDYHTAQGLINKRSAEIFGFKKDPAIPYIMVTLDEAYKNEVALMRKLLVAGMNVARINCAHGNEDDWKAMILSVKKASDISRKPCKIYMDIAGPKMRVELPGIGKEEGKMTIKKGQEIMLVENGEQVKPDKYAIACFEKGVISKLKPGERIIIDDGKFEGIVKNKNGKLICKITRISSKKPVIKKEKGLNLPDTVLDIPALTAADLKAIPFIAKHADLAGCSFLRTPADVKFIQNTFKKAGRIPKLILKIETLEAVSNLPALLLAAMRQETFGVMIARGDLAVEIGFERLSEIQDEILWICEAAHAPVIWATQVLETFCKTGIATRSEITDAAHSAMAECVMLNKGKYIVETITTLKGILNRSGGHILKKRYSLRPLHIAEHFFYKTEF